MLENLHVKNLALIDEIEIDFRSGLNILTGETGAGKSILLGSVNLALGGRYSADLIRTGAKFGLVELTFLVEDPVLEKRLEQMDIFTEDHRVVLNRKLMEGRSVCKINGETVNMSTLREVAALLIDIHEQHEHQSLMNKRNHLAFLDLYAKDQVDDLKQRVADAYRTYKELQKKLESSTLDERERKKEVSLTEYEIQEIEEAELVAEEDEQLEQQYQRMINGKKITEGIAETYQYTSEDSSGNASSYLSRAIRALQEVESCDQTGHDLYEQLIEIDSLLNDFNRELSDYSKSFEFSEEEYYQTETRLNTINHLKAKYGNSIAEILEYYQEKQQRLMELEDYEHFIMELQKSLKKAEVDYLQAAEALSNARKEYAIRFTKEICQGLEDLNFLNVEFEMRFHKMEKYSATGIDEAEFFISTNPGEALHPLGTVASGGELSRIMLAIKAVLADKEETPTLIFDEIDTGISGITAGKVAEKMKIISRSRQVLCITHLAQIAAMADAHYKIQKEVIDGSTKTEIKYLQEESSIQELARLLGGAKITDSILKSAKEMKELAN